jgi:hypothetical protein
MAWLTAALWLRIIAEGRLQIEARVGWATDRAALVIVAVVAYMVATRSPDFGVDTAAYASVFTSYCFGQSPADLGIDFYLSSAALNLAMFGACDVRALPAAWVLLMVAGAMILPSPLGERLRFMALLAVSLVGFELMTNALRQGLSAVLLVGAISWWPRSRLVGLILAVAAIAMHASSGLILIAAVAARFGWAGFVLAAVAGSVFVTVVVQRGIDVALLGPFLFEIQKYMAHESDELWIRLLSSASLLAIVAMPILVADATERRKALTRSASYSLALRLAGSSIPFLLLPYFGYRYIYGVLPVVLWLVLRTVASAPRLAARAFAALMLANIAVLLVWSWGSSYMRSVPFYE